MAGRKLIAAGLILLLLGAPAGTGGLAASAAALPEGIAREPGAPGPRMDLRLRDGLVFLEAWDVELPDLLRAFAEKAGIGLTLGEGVSGRVGLTLAGVPLEEALRQLCQSRAILYEYDPVTRTVRIVGAGAFAAGKGERPEARTGAAVPGNAAPASAGPVPPEVAGRTPAMAGQQALSGPPLTEDIRERLRDSQGRLLYKPRELLVQFRPEATAEQVAALHASLGSLVVKSLESPRLHRIRLRDGLGEGEAIPLYRASPIVTIAERHGLRYPMLAPNDPSYVNNTQWGMKRIQMPGAWDITTGKPTVVIGHIDTGVDTGHPDLGANLLPGRDLAGNLRFVDGDDVDGNPMDLYGHGTHVAGIIAAVGNNGVGVAGVGWGLKILPLKVLADDYASYPDGAVMETFDIVAAIYHAIAQQVRIVNCSFGGEAGTDLQTEYSAFVALRTAGILAVCAAGNFWNDNDGENAIYPASHNLDNIISVAASLNPEASPIQPENLWASSNYGYASVDLMAPGSGIFSTCRCSAAGNCATNGYCSMSGTSTAAPHVSGVAGLILSRNPHLSYGRVKAVILDSVDKIASVTAKLVSGGRLNAASALGKVCLPGDLTRDGRVDLADVILALQVSAGLDHSESARACATADVDGDDQVGLAEAVFGLKVLSGAGG